jgi:hypothetical protein
LELSVADASSLHASCFTHAYVNEPTHRDRLGGLRHVCLAFQGPTKDRAARFGSTPFPALVTTNKEAENNERQA